MTIQLSSAWCAKSKKTLAEALNAPDGRKVSFNDPSIFPGSRGFFPHTDIKPGESFPVVMDPATRMRFATVTRRADGTFRVT